MTDAVDSKASAAGGGAQPPRPTIAVPPRPASFESFFAGGSIPGFSPGPMTLLSSMFSPDSNSCSFSQLLAGAMASPVAKTSFLLPENNSTENRYKELTPGDASDKGSGYKQHRPMGLMVAHSPLFLVPSGLSPSGLLNSPGFLSPLQSPFGMSHQQALAHVTAQAAFSQSFKQMQADYQHSSSALTSAELQPSSVPAASLQQNFPSQPQCLKMGASEAPQSDKKPGAITLDKPADDGYNWRKYGQKLVKTKEHPRSYYKCTYLNCPVKKKVERAPDGHITEITYKGQHNHEVPQHNIRAKDGSNAGNTAMNSREMSYSKNQTQMNVLNEVETFNSNSRKNKVPAQSISEQLPVDGEHDEMEDSAIVIDEENDDDEPNSKRRSTGVGAYVSAPSLKTITEPKIVVQTRSEVDLLDDGYKWRKYGQKVVKGNPHPRSYYRCTYAGCNVRKHVERASNDPKAVITTYEGKHNHDIPTARNNNQSVANSGTMQLKPQRVPSRKASVLRGREFENKDQIQVFSQLKEGEIAA